MIIGYVNRPGKELLGEIELAGELSFDYFELTVEAPKATGEIIHRDRRQAIDMLLSYNLGIVGHMPWYLHVAFPYESVQRACIAEFENAIDAAGSLGAKKITIHTEFLPKFHGTREEMVAQTNESIAMLADYCRARGMNLLIENYMDFSMNLDELESLIRYCKVGMTYDVGHELANSGGDTKQVILSAKRFEKHIRHMHFSDNDGKADSHMALGRGKMDWKKLIPALKGMYDGPITLEIAQQKQAGKTAVKKTAKAKSHAKKSESSEAVAAAAEKDYRKSVFESKVFVEKNWYGRKKTKNDYEYIYPGGKKPELGI
ncbi:MAG: sugar phosphate isomerase/epimerase family protein [Candidatus Micrarchaeia archaeon]